MTIIIVGGGSKELGLDIDYAVSGEGALINRFFIIFWQLRLCYDFLHSAQTLVKKLLLNL